jgi:hypothetical protein
LWTAANGRQVSSYLDDFGQIEWPLSREAGIQDNRISANRAKAGDRLNRAKLAA